MESQNLYKQKEQEREKCSNSIIQSSTKKIVVAAGPGTGKTFLFKSLCQRKKGKIIVLSFINELVDDLRRELGKIAEVKTLHGFARGKLRCKFYIKLTDLIEEDYSFIYNKEANFKENFELLKDDNKKLSFYSKRRQFYDHFGPHCSIFALLKYFEKYPNKIPKYSQVLIDEFQDFNKLEIKLIDILAENNSILIAGDDDQSLYSFKKADPREIQQRYKNKNYESFQLPYCSRCTKVLVQATNDLIEKSKKRGYLNKRIEKEYKYFDSIEKDRISNKNPKIILQNCVYQNQTAYKITKNIEAISNEEEDFEVLIICPYKKNINNLKIALNKKGFKNIQTPNTAANGVSKREAYRILLEDERSNLGWRILINFILDKRDAQKIIKKSYKTGGSIVDLIEEKNKKLVLNTLKILRKVKKEKELKEKDVNSILDNLDYSLSEIVKDKLKEDIIDNSELNKSFEKIPIRIVTMLGAKGLSSDYVFMVNFDDKFTIDKKRGIDDETIRKFLVVLTRARKRLTIMNSGGKIPKLVSWLEGTYYKISQ